jgi:hypothetical protein
VKRVSFDLSGVFSSMGIVFYYLWAVLAVPVGILVGSAVVSWVRWLLVFRAGIEKRRAKYL